MALIPVTESLVVFWQETAYGWRYTYLDPHSRPRTSRACVIIVSAGFQVAFVPGLLTEPRAHRPENDAVL